MAPTADPTPSLPIPDALLLLGPTGSGKTPLGQALASRSLAGRRCVHFDFGHHLRRVAASAPNAIVSASDIDFIRDVLRTGALLEDQDFPIAARVLRDFLVRERTGRQTLIVLNGLPRHAGQATAVAEILQLRAVVHLRCSVETVDMRIATNAGGDRTDRKDDDLAAVRRKLDLYTQRTAPLVEYYRVRGTPVIPLHVTADMTAQRMCELLDRELASVIS